jgi:DNA polymerase I
MKRFVIIDGNSLFFRAYFASAYGGPPMTTKDGTPTNAVFVFANMLAKIMQGFNEHTHCLVAFDTGEKTFRHQALTTYKAHRKPVPEDLIKQFPIVREFLKALGMFTFELNGYEGDDVAGTAAVIAGKQGYQVDLYTSDRDFLQLANENIRVMLIKKGVTDIVLMTPEKVFLDYGYHPHQVPDYKGLVGDSSDNIPGIPGIGEKTAVKLIHQYQTFEAILQAADTIGGKVGQNLKEHREIGLLSKNLAIIDTNIPLPFSIEDTLYSGIQSNAMHQFIQRYEMRSLINRFSSANQPTSQLPTFTHVNQLPSIKDIQECSIVPAMSEGNYFKTPLLGYAIKINDHGYYVTLDVAKNDHTLIEVLKNPSIKKITYDFKALIVSSHLQGITVSGDTFDVMIAGQTLEESSTFSKKFFFSQFDLELSEDPVARAIQICDRLTSIQPLQLAQLEAKSFTKVIDTIEFPLIPVLAKMEIEGVPIDLKILDDIAKDVKEKLETLEKEIYHHAGDTFNIDSPKQVSQILFEQLKLPNYKKGSTNVDVLKSLMLQHPIIEPLLSYRKFAKLLSTYLNALPLHAYSDNRLHPIYNQAQTTTGRLSSYDPNIQNISVKDEETKIIRKAFYFPSKDEVFLSFDYSQIELRILAELAQCQPLIDVFNKDEDIHTATAKRLFKDKDSSQSRRLAKAVNFGIIYGISSWGLAEQLHIPPQEANVLIDQFYSAYPELKTYMQGLIKQLQEQKYVSTLLGRRRYLPEISGNNFQAREFAKRAAMNAPIQGTAADLIKLAMIQVDHYLTTHKFKTKLMLTIHDELIFRTPVDELDRVKPIIQDIMEHALPLNVKLKVEGNHADNWYALK